MYESFFGEIGGFLGESDFFELSRNWDNYEAFPDGFFLIFFRDFLELGSAAEDVQSEDFSRLCGANPCSDINVDNCEISTLENAYFGTDISNNYCCYLSGGGSERGSISEVDNRFEFFDFSLFDNAYLCSDMSVNFFGGLSGGVDRGSISEINYYIERFDISSVSHSENSRVGNVFFEYGLSDFSLFDNVYLCSDLSVNFWGGLSGGGIEREAIFEVVNLSDRFDFSMFFDGDIGIDFCGSGVIPAIAGTILCGRLGEENDFSGDVFFADRLYSVHSREVFRDEILLGGEDVFSSDGFLADRLYSAGTSDVFRDEILLGGEDVFSRDAFLAERLYSLTSREVFLDDVPGGKLGIAAVEVLQNDYSDEANELLLQKRIVSNLEQIARSAAAKQTGQIMEQLKNNDFDDSPRNGSVRGLEGCFLDGIEERERLVGLIAGELRSALEFSAEGVR